MATMVELFSFIGFPARLGGRALLVTRYITNGGATTRVKGNYAELRFGKSVRWRPWLMIDVKELEEVEDLINRATDERVEGWRTSQLSVCGMIAIIGALVAGTGLTALQLPSLESVHFVARGTFVMSLILALLSVFFSGLQQSSFGRATSTQDLRRWLSCGTYFNINTGKTELRSSMVSHMILQAPFEIVVMSITLFVVGVGVYLGDGWMKNLDMSTGGNGDRAVLIAFVVPTVFVLLMYGHMMGWKDRELEKMSSMCDAGEVKFEVGSTEDVEQPRLSPVKGSEIVGTTSGLAGLKEALQEAAESHHRSARASEEVAKQYERLLQSL